jgi:hypothetical protein
LTPVFSATIKIKIKFHPQLKRPGFKALTTMIQLQRFGYIAANEIKRGVGLYAYLLFIPVLS